MCHSLGQSPNRCLRHKVGMSCFNLVHDKKLSCLLASASPNTLIWTPTTYWSFSVMYFASSSSVVAVVLSRYDFLMQAVEKTDLSLFVCFVVL